MNGRDMQYFLYLAQTGNYSRTAKKFGISQPSVTYAIRRLEQALGATLFVRDQSHRAACLTPAGQIFYDFAKTTTEEYAFVRAQIEGLSAARITIGLPNTIASARMSDLYEAVRQSGLSEKIRYINDASTALLKRMREGKLNLSLVSSTTLIQEKRLTAQIICQQPFEIVVSTAHPLAGKKAVSLSEAAAYPFLLLSPASNHYAAFKKVMTARHLHPVIAHQNRDITVLYDMIRSQLGIGFLAEIDKSKRHEPDIVYLPIRDAGMPRLLINLVYARGVETNPAYQQAMSVLRKLYQDNITQD